MFKIFGWGTMGTTDETVEAKSPPQKGHKHTPNRNFDSSARLEWRYRPYLGIYLSHPNGNKKKQPKHFTHYAFIVKDLVCETCQCRYVEEKSIDFDVAAFLKPDGKPNT